MTQTLRISKDQNNEKLRIKLISVLLVKTRTKQANKGRKIIMDNSIKKNNSRRFSYLLRKSASLGTLGALATLGTLASLGTLGALASLGTLGTLASLGTLGAFLGFHHFDTSRL